ncbi:MAG: PfkB family carbohydrate kinase [Pseudomonadota bacterium]
MVDVFVAGALNWDTIVDAPHLPRLDETVVGSGVAYQLGGKGGNQAVQAARLGASVKMAGSVGDDANGASLREALESVGVDTSQVATVPGPSGMSVAIVQSDGEYGAAIVPGANARVDPTRVDIPEGTSVVLLQNEIPDFVNAAIMARVPETAQIVLNAAPARDMSPGVIGRTDVLIVNRVEAAGLLGSEMDGLRSARALLALGPATVIVTLGSGGLAFAVRDGPSGQRSARNVSVSSAHGAGDAFTGAFAVALAQAMPLEKALQFAQAAAALHVSTAPEARGTIDMNALRQVIS